MKHVEARLSARDDRESSFHHCGSPSGWCKPFYVREKPVKSVLTYEVEQ